MQACELTSSEAEDLLKECEHDIELHLEGFEVVGRRLMQIRDAKLYSKVLGFKTFAEYCEEKWSITKSYANNLIKADAVIRNLTTIVVKPQTESQVRPLTRIKEPEEQQAAWQEAVATAPAGKITAKHVEEVVQRRTKTIADREPKIESNARMPGQTFAEEQKIVDQAMNLIRAANELLARCLKQHGFGERSIERIRDAAETLRTLGE